MTEPRFVIGVDEVGCGAIAGPLIVAAIAFAADAPRVTTDWRGVRGVKTLTAGDSKRVKNPDHRAALATAIRTCAASIAVIERTASDIDARLLRTVFPEAVELAVRRCAEHLVSDAAGLCADEVLVLVDGDIPRPNVPCPVRMMPGGDALDWRIGAASIIAKARHDEHVTRLAAAYPTWNFDRHRGYPTRAHLEQLAQDGILVVHRRTFAPVREARGDIPGMEG